MHTPAARQDPEIIASTPTNPTPATKPSHLLQRDNYLPYPKATTPTPNIQITLHDAAEGKSFETAQSLEYRHVWGQVSPLTVTQAESEPGCTGPQALQLPTPHCFRSFEINRLMPFCCFTSTSLQASISLPFPMTAAAAGLPVLPLLPSSDLSETDGKSWSLRPSAAAAASAIFASSSSSLCASASRAASAAARRHWRSHCCCCAEASCC